VTCSFRDSVRFSFFLFSFPSPLCLYHHRHLFHVVLFWHDKSWWYNGTHRNAAFAKLGDDLLGCLSQPEYVPVLQDILNYHYTYGKVLAGDLSSGQVITMANGKDITINIDDSLVYINECPDFPTGCPFVQITDVMATNGVIHAINNVLIPPDVDVAGFLDMCLATDPPEPTPAPQPEPTPAPTPELTPEPTPKPTRSSKSSKKTRRSGSTSKSKRY